MRCTVLWLSKRQMIGSACIFADIERRCARPSSWGKPPCRLWVRDCPSDYVGSTSGVPHIADDLSRRSIRQPWATLRHLMRPLPTFDGRRLSEDQQPQEINSLLTTRYIHDNVYV
jgi:hypothetical protein